MELSPDFWPWVSAHADDDTAALRLKYGRARSLEILQIESRRKYRTKLGGVFDLLPRFVIPNSLSPEQSTSWDLARFHAMLIPEGVSVADFTAGMGIDVLALSQRAASVLAIERDADIADSLRHNFSGIDNVTVECADCRDILMTGGRHFDVIFIDPARRADDGSRLYALAQCAPDVVGLMPAMLEMAPTVIVKASPMLDITHTLAELPQTSHIYVAGTPTECKELLCVCSRDNIGESEITAVTARGDEVSQFSFTGSQERSAEARFAVPQEGQYVYDPYPAVMKSGAYNLLSERYAAARLNPNTQLWTSCERVDFPGHAFYVTEVLPYASKHIKRYAAAHPRVSVTARNFDMDSAALRRKLGVRDASDERLFAVKGPSGEKILITCRAISSEI